MFLPPENYSQDMTRQAHKMSATSYLREGSLIEVMNARADRLDRHTPHSEKCCILKQYSWRACMFVELVYDKRNVEGLAGAREIILDELTRRVHRIFPDAEVKVKPMQANGLNSDASKSDREKLNRMLEEMFEEAEMWLVAD